MTTRELIVHAAHLTGVRTADIYGPRRERFICAIRSAVYIVALEQGRTQSGIARVMSRDHTTIMNGVQQYDTYTRFYPQLVILTHHLRASTGNAGCVPFRFRTRRVSGNHDGGKKWTDSEIEIVRGMQKKGAQIDKIASTLGRSYDSVRHVYRRIINAPRPTLEREADRHLLGVE